MDKFKLIAEVKERPHLWRIPVSERDKDTVKTIWNEISECMGATEKMCRMEWKQLRSLYGRKKERREKHIEVLRRKGNFDKRKNYDVKWIYYEPLNFLDVVFEDNKYNHKSNSASTKVMLQQPLEKIAAIKLIAEVKERKYLWKTQLVKRDKKIWNYLWTEVAEGVGATEENCRSKWHELRRLYSKERERIETLKHTGNYDDNESSDGKWKFYKNMKFLDDEDKSSDQNSNVNRTQDYGLVSHQPFGEIWDKFKLIAEVKKRPYLWKKGVKGSIQLFNYFWSEISEVFGVKVETLRSKWNFLRRCYKEKYVALRREYLSYDETIVKNWIYFNHLKFLNIIFDAEYKFPPLDADENVDVNVSDQHSNSTDSDALEGYCKIEIEDNDQNLNSEFENEVYSTASLNEQTNKWKPDKTFTCTNNRPENFIDLFECKTEDQPGSLNHHAPTRNDQQQNIESICVKEEPVIECSELTNIPIKSEESSICIKEEPETQQTTTQLNDQLNYVYTITEIKEEAGDDRAGTSVDRLNHNQEIGDLKYIKEEPQFPNLSP